MVVWGDLFTKFVSDLFLSSTKVTALHKKTPFWFFSQFPPDNLAINKKVSVFMWAINVLQKLWRSLKVYWNVDLPKPSSGMTGWSHLSWNKELLGTRRIMIPSEWHHSFSFSVILFTSTKIWVPQSPSKQSQLSLLAQPRKFNLKRRITCNKTRTHNLTEKWLCHSRVGFTAPVIAGNQTCPFEVIVSPIHYIYDGLLMTFFPEEHL